MSRTTTVLAGLGGMAAGMMTGAGLVTFLAGRSRPAIEGLSALNTPEDLPPARVVTVPARGEIFFRDRPGPADDSPTIVLLHGWVVTADLNWFTCYETVGQHGRILAPDHRGHGRGARHSHPFRLAEVADDVAAMIRQLDVGPVVLVGFSMGGPLAQLVWQRHPDLVAGVVLCATGSHFHNGLFGGVHWRLMSLYQVGTRLLPRAWLERVLLAQVQGRAPIRLVQSIGPEVAAFTPLLPWVVGEIERGNKEDVAEAGRQLGQFDSRGWIGGLDVPAALIVTTRDRLVPPTAQLELAALLPHALVLDVDGDHDAPASVPKAFNEALDLALTHVLDGPGERASGHQTGRGAASSRQRGGWA